MTRKEAIREFKERKPVRGVYAVRSAATGHVWVGSFSNLEAIRNRTWFTLAQRTHRDCQLQEEWNIHGEQTFQFEIIEKFDDDLCALEVNDLLKDRKKHWVAKLNAKVL